MESHCMESHASCRWKGSKMVWLWHAVQIVPPWYIVLSNMLSNMLSNIVNIANEALLQPMHTHCHLPSDAFLSG